MVKARTTRRDALRAIGAGMGSAASMIWAENLRALVQEHAMRAGAPVASEAQAAAAAPKVLDARDFETVGTLVELIIPATDTPGARAAQVDRYIDAALESGLRSDRETFLSGLKWLDRRSRTLFGKPLTGATAAQQTDLLTRLSADGNPSGEARQGREFFAAIKSMTIAGYYTTEVGLHQELGDDGRLVLAEFEGCTHPEHQ
jgi:hypothetical protein